MRTENRVFARSRRTLIVVAAVSLSMLLHVAYAAPSAPARPGTLRLSFVGDILLAGTVGDLIEAEGPQAPWLGVKDLLSSSDLTCGNLECAVGTTGTPIPGKTYTFRADPKALQGLVDSGFDVVSLANNHTLDYGVECLLEGVEAVKDAGISAIGAGANESAAREPFIFEKNGLRVGILATAVVVPDPSWAAKEESPGLAVDYFGWYPGIVASIGKLAETVDVVVVVIHWGEERTSAPVKWIGAIHKAIREAGAHVVIGSHPHVLEGIYYDGRTVTAYSLGNFVFSTRPEIPACQVGAVLNLTVSKGKVDAAEVIPTKIVWGRTVPMEGKEKEAALATLSSLSRPLGTDLDQYGNVVPLLFTDMNDHWARFTVGKLASRGSIEGYPDLTFRPEVRITKGEFAAMFSRAVASPADIAAAVEPQGFALCSKDAWSYTYLKYLASRGILPASDPNWAADRACSRLDACLAMWKHAGAPSSENAVAEAIGLDAKSAAAISWAVDMGILRGYPDGSLRLAETISRAEMAEILSRYLGTT